MNFLTLRGLVPLHWSAASLAALEMASTTLSAFALLIITATTEKFARL